MFDANVANVGAYRTLFARTCYQHHRYAIGDGIDPHNDGALFEPCVAIVSLGSEALLRFLPKLADRSVTHASKTAGVGTASHAASAPAPALANVTAAAAAAAATSVESAWAAQAHPRSTCSVLLRPGSLALFSGAAYKQYLHGIVSAADERVEAHTVNRDGRQVGAAVLRGCVGFHRCSSDFKCFRRFFFLFFFFSWGWGAPQSINTISCGLRVLGHFIMAVPCSATPLRERPGGGEGGVPFHPSTVVQPSNVQLSNL
jgi:hypothetical protein